MPEQVRALPQSSLDSHHYANGVWMKREWGSRERAPHEAHTHHVKLRWQGCPQPSNHMASSDRSPQTHSLTLSLYLCVSPFIYCRCSSHQLPLVYSSCLIQFVLSLILLSPMPFQIRALSSFFPNRDKLIAPILFYLCSVSTTATALLLFFSSPLLSLFLRLHSVYWTFTMHTDRGGERVMGVRCLEWGSV